MPSAMIGGSAFRLKKIVSFWSKYNVKVAFSKAVWKYRWTCLEQAAGYGRVACTSIFSFGNEPPEALLRMSGYFLRALSYACLVLKIAGHVIDIAKGLDPGFVSIAYN